VPRLFRPSIPVAVKVRVALCQLGELWPDRVIAERRSAPGGLGALLRERLTALGEILGQRGAESLHLDHRPPLAVRRRFPRNDGTCRYEPDANDPEFLVYLTADAHRFKTNQRGDGAQHPDRVLIRRARRLEKPLRQKPKRKWQSRPFPKCGQKIQSRPFRRKP
jgi:hypothetical protein